MLATNYAFDMHARFHRDEFPVSCSSEGERPGFDDPLLPGKSASQKEVDRHGYYFKFADDAKARLESRDLLVKTSNDGVDVFEVKPDAREKLKNAFSGFLTSFVSFGANNEVAKPMDLASGLVSGCIGVATVIPCGIFAFNTIVAGLKKAFSSHNPYFEQAGKLVYLITSAVHTILGTIQPIIHQAIPFQSNEIVVAVLVTIEILLGLYATTTATEASLARTLKKSEILSMLITNKEKAKAFFDKSRNSDAVTEKEALAYEKFMEAIGKLDELSGETSFATMVAATTTIKETLWLSGSVAGNETVYKNLASSEIAVDGAEVVGTSLAEIGLAMVANIIDSIHGAVVYCRCEERIAHARGIKKKLAVLFKQSKAPESKPLIKGLARVIDRKIQDEEFEQGFSVARLLKAIPLVITGIVAVALIACAVVYTFPLWLPLGIISGLFFLLLIARTIRTAGRTKDDKAEEDIFGKRKVLENIWDDTQATLHQSPENKFSLFHALSVLLVAQVNRWDDDNELKEILTALEFNEVEINMLRNLALINDNCAENIKMVKKQLARMLELKIVGA